MNGWGGITIKLLIICRSIRRVSGCIVGIEAALIDLCLWGDVGKCVLEREKLAKENAWVLDE